MIRLALISLLGACGPSHQGPTQPPPPPPAIATVRTMSVEEASQALWRFDLKPAWRDLAPAEGAALRGLVLSLWEAAPSGTLPADAAKAATSLGMRIERWRLADREHWVLQELDDARHGAGAYVFAIGAPSPAVPALLLESPHAYHDLNTGRIGAAMYFTPPAGPAPRAFFTNTVHRYTTSTGARTPGKDAPADACHNPFHPIAVATLAVARTLPGITVIQLHGFAAGGATDEDESGPPASVSAVVSAGRKEVPSPLSQAVATRLKEQLGAGVMLYPTDIALLGATTNVEMRALDPIPTARFLHLELSSTLRDQLLHDAARRDAVATTLFSLGSAP